MNDKKLINFGKVFAVFNQIDLLNVTILTDIKLTPCIIINRQENFIVSETIELVLVWVKVSARYRLIKLNSNFAETILKSELEQVEVHGVSVFGTHHR